MNLKYLFLFPLFLLHLPLLSYSQNTASPRLKAKATAHSVQLKWKAVPFDSTTAFRIQRRNKDSEWETAGEVYANDKSKEHFEFQDFPRSVGEYSYRLQLLSKGKLWTCSEEVSAYLGTTRFSVSLPKRNMLSVSKKKKEADFLQIFDEKGRLVIEKQVTKDIVHIPISLLPSGRYRLRMDGINRSFVKPAF